MVRGCEAGACAGNGSKKKAGKIKIRAEGRNDEGRNARRIGQIHDVGVVAVTSHESCESWTVVLYLFD